MTLPTRALGRSGLDLPDETAALWYQDDFAVEFRLMFFE